MRNLPCKRADAVEETPLTHVVYACDNDEHQQVGGSGASYKAISPVYSDVLYIKRDGAPLYEQNSDANLMSCKS